MKKVYCQGEVDVCLYLSMFGNCTHDSCFEIIDTPKERIKKKRIRNCEEKNRDNNCENYRDNFHYRYI